VNEEAGRANELVSAVIPCYNGGQYLADTIRGIKSQTIPFAEILVVDDGSSDDTCKVAADNGCFVLRHSRNRGLAAARNTGIANARSHLIAFVDADVVLDPNWLQTLIPRFVEDSTIVQVGGRLVETYQHTAPDRWRALHMKQDCGDRPLKIDCRTTGRIAGFAYLAKRDALLSVGLYDPKFSRSFEDVDMSARLLEKGYVLYYDPSALCYHRRRDSIHSLLASSWSWDFWPARLKGRYDSFYSVLLKIRDNLTAWGQLSREHIANRDYALLGIDCNFLIISSFWDVRYYLSSTYSWAATLFGPSHLGNVGS